MTASRRPVVPWASLLCGALALAMFLVAGGAPAALVFDRAAIEEGEIWRLVTGHLAHTDGSHLTVNLVGLVVLGLLFERHPAIWGLLFGISATVIDLWLWFLRPDIEQYCGLSGVLYGFFAAGLLVAWADGRRRWLVAAVGIAAAGKTFLELKTNGVWPDHTAWPVVPEAHGAGALAGLLVTLMTRKMRI